MKVQDGCDCHCSYCIIPKVRGGARSRPASAVLREARRRVTQGQPEMVMTGISVGDYRDPERGLELGDLMREVAAIEGVERVRLSSVEVIHVRDSLLDALAEEPRICPHLHVPLQSGDDAVLASMGRNYDSAGYLAAVARLRDARAAREPDDRRDRRLPDRGRGRRSSARSTSCGRPASPACTRSASRPVRERRPTASATRCRPPRRSAAAASCAGCRRRCRAVTGRESSARVEEVLVDKVADTQASGYSRDYTRYYLPAGSARAGEVVAVRAEELHSDGCAATSSPRTRGRTRPDRRPDR